MSSLIIIHIKYANKLKLIVNNTATDEFKYIILIGL
jgi:hypothetical protein